jgi:hypothetical protein
MHCVFSSPGITLPMVMASLYESLEGVPALPPEPAESPPAALPPEPVDAPPEPVTGVPPVPGTETMPPAPITVVPPAETLLDPPAAAAGAPPAATPPELDAVAPPAPPVEDASGALLEPDDEPHAARVTESAIDAA